MEFNDNNLNTNSGEGYTVTPEGGYYNNVEHSVQNSAQAPNPVVYTPPAVSYSVPSYGNKPKNKSKVNWLTVFISAVLCGAICAVSCFVSITAAKGSGSKGGSGSGDIISGEQAPSQNVTINVDETVNSSIEAVAAKVTPSVVGIRTTASVQNFFGGNSESTGEGSGIVYSGDGYIITNYHVIESAIQSGNATIEVFLSEDPATGIKATVVGYNISCDLAVIKIDRTNLPALNIADVGDLKVGQYVVAIGASGGLEFMGTVTNGIISGLNRKTGATGTGEDLTLIQTNAAINPGNSGGALVNLKGELVGVNSSKIASVNFEGMGFAIPADTVVEVVGKIIAKENNPDPYIGVTLSQSWTPERLTQYGYPVGAVITAVNDGGPADEADIRAGDIIVEFGKVKIESSLDLSDAVADSTIGSTVSVKIYRSGRYYSTGVIIGSNNAQ